MQDDDSQAVTQGQLKEFTEQMNNNQQSLLEQLTDMKREKIKMPSIERFAGEKQKIKGFLTQMKMKILHEGTKLSQPSDQVAYAGLFLTGRALEWFEPYLTDIQANGLATTNLEARYMFSSWEGFASRLTQMYGDPESVATAEGKLYVLTQKGSAMDYTTQFQTLAAQTEWNQGALMAQYRRGLKAKVQTTMIPMDDPSDMRDLIEQAIRVDNRLYQSEKSGRTQQGPVHAKRTQQQVSKPWYGAEPMDLSGTRESKRKTWKPRGQGSSDQRSREQRPNQGSQQQKTFRRTPQQDKWYKEGACMNCGKQGHYARNCRGG